MIAQPQPRLTIALPPVYRPRVNETIQFDLYCFGRSRHAVGQVLEITQGGIPLVRYEVALPSEAETRADYPYSFRYPIDGIYRGDVYLPLEQVRPYDGEQLTLNDRAEINHTAIARLEAERDRLLSEGEIAPQGAWIECGEVRHRPGWRQAVWRAQSRAFIGKAGNATSHQYIGREGSDKHKRAIASYERRKRLEQITRQISILEELNNA